MDHDELMKKLKEAIAVAEKTQKKLREATQMVRQMNGLTKEAYQHASAN